MKTRLAARRLTALAVPVVFGLAALTPVPATAAGATRVAGTITAISLTAPASIPVGAYEVALSNVPTSVLGDGAGADGTPVRGVPVRGVPVRGVPVRGVPVRGVPVRGVPVRGVPVRGVPVRGVPVRGVPVSQIPLLPASGKTWPALLAAIPSLANKPLQSVSFGDYLDAAPNTDLTLGDIDLANSPLRSVPLEGWLLATVPASQIVYPGGSLCDLAKRQTNLAQCDATVVNSIAYDYSPAVPTVLDLALAGIDFTSVPWARVPLAQISTDAPIRAIVLGGANGGRVDTSSIGALSLSGLNYDKTTALASASFNQTATLGSQQKVFDQLAAANTPIKLGDLSLYNAAIQATDVETLGVRPSVADAMSTLIDSTSANWESANLGALNLPEYDSAQSAGTWTASVTATATSGAPAGSVVPTLIKLTLPDGFDAMTASVSASGTTLTPNSVKRDGARAVIDVDAPSGVAMSITFTALGPLDIRATGASSTLVASPFGGADATATSGGTTVVARGVAHAKVAPDVLMFDYINSSATDTTATFTYPAPPMGTRVFALLGNLPADYDMTVYGPAGGLGGVSSSPFRSVAQASFAARPSLGLNLADGLKSDPGSDNGPTTSAPVSGQIAEIPLHQGASNLPVIGISNTTGTGSEEVGWVSEGTGNYTIVVSAKSGANSPKPFTLRIKTIAPAPAAVCKPAVPFGTAVTYPATGIDLVAPPTPATTSPIAVIDRVAFQARYGATATTAMWNSLVAFRTQPDLVPLRFVLLDTDPAYAAAAQARMANPCDLQQTFTEVDRIGSLVRAAKAANPQAASVIMVGSDEQVPMARVRDQAWTFNEAQFADEAVDTTANPISVSAQQGFVLSDTPYAISAPSLAGQEALMLPDMGIGRLVESPTQVQAQLDLYTKNLGQLNMTKKGFTYQRYGYGFLTDGTNAIGTSLAAGTGIEAAGSAVNDSWDGTALTGSGGAFSATGAASVTVLNAHFDPRRLLAACGDPIVTPAPSCLKPLVGTADYAGPTLAGKLLMSLGCHSGLNMPNGYVPAGSAQANDWAETLMTREASLWLGNTGYGYGDSDVVGYSEQLMTNFANQVTLAPNAGLALAYAKQQYQAGQVALSDIDLKVMSESTLYGLPLWIGKNTNRVSVLKTTRAATALSPSLSYADLSVSPTLTSVASTRGTYYTSTATGATSTVATTPGLPLTPHLDLPFSQTTALIAGSRLRGVEVTSLTGTALTSEDPVISRAVVDSSVREGEPAVPNTVWPPSVQTSSWMTTSAGDEDRVGINPTVTFPKAGGLIDREKFTAVGVRAYYSASKRLVPPVIQRLDVSGNVLTVTAVKSDNSADNLPIDHVSVLGWDGVSVGGWAKYGPTVGVGPTFSYALSANTKYLYVQVVDQAGNVSSAWKVVTPGVVTSSAGTATVTGPSVPGTPGKFSGPATISASWPSGAHIKLGTPAAADSSNPVVVASTMPAYLVDGYNAIQKAWSFSIDSTPPAIPAAGAGQVIGANGATVNVPAAAGTAASGGTVVNFPTSTTDVGDGTVPLTCLPASGSSFPVGSTKVGCQAVDSAGNRQFTTFTLTVQDPYITVPAPITAEATGPTGAIVTYTATAIDTVDGARPVTCAPASGSTFAIATTTVTCTASDTRGLTSTSTFTVTVRDTTPPALTLPASVAATATSATGAVVTYATSATDKVDGARPVACTPASGSTFAVGATTVNCSSSDARVPANTGTGSFVVTVAKAADATLPTVTFTPVSGGKILCKLTCASTALSFVTADATTNSTWQNVSGVASVVLYTATTLSTVTTTPVTWSKGVVYAVTGGSLSVANTVGNKQWVRVDVKDVSGNLTQGIWWVSA